MKTEGESPMQKEGKRPARGKQESTLAQRALREDGPKGLERMWSNPQDAPVRRLLGDQELGRLEFPDGSAAVRCDLGGERNSPQWSVGVHRTRLADPRILKISSKRMDETDEEGFDIVPIDGVEANPGSASSWSPWIKADAQPDWALPADVEDAASAR